MDSILRFLQTTMSDLGQSVPTNYSLFHIVSIIILVGVITLLIYFSNRMNDKTYRIICFVSWTSLVLFEIYKQIVFTFGVGVDGTITSSYQWYAFPFQLCSSPLYVLPFVIFLKEGKVRDCFLSFLTTFCLFGGLAVYVFPNDVFTNYLGINIQTMVHHGSQIALGIFTAFFYRVKLKKMSFYFKGVIPFVGLCIIAIVLNETVGAYARSVGQEFNMFYFSRFHPCTLPLLSLIYPHIHPILFLFLYIIGFILLGFIIYWLEFPLTLFKTKKSQC